MDMLFFYCILCKLNLFFEGFTCLNCLKLATYLVCLNANFFLLNVLIFVLFSMIHNTKQNATSNLKIGGEPRPE